TIDQLIEARLRTQPSAHWLKVLEDARIPCGPVNDFKKALEDPQVVARGMVTEVTLKGGKNVPMPGNPVKLSRQQVEHYTAPPELGEHTQAILEGMLGYDAERITRLRDAAVIG